MAQCGPSMGRAGVDRREGQRQATEPGLLRINTAEGEQTAEGATVSQWRQRLPSVNQQTDPPFPPGTPVLTQHPQDWQRGPDAAHTAWGHFPHDVQRGVSLGDGGGRASTPRPSHDAPPLPTPPAQRPSSGQERGLGDAPASCMLCPAQAPRLGRLSSRGRPLCGTPPSWGSNPLSDLWQPPASPWCAFLERPSGVTPGCLLTHVLSWPLRHPNIWDVPDSQ